jgi:hypothetical protein
MATTAYIGLALTSHNSSSLCAATFDNVTAPGWANPIPPNAPASLTAIVTNWNVASDLAGLQRCHQLQREARNNLRRALHRIANVTTTNYADNTMANNTNYYYVVSALNAAVKAPIQVRRPCPGKSLPRRDCSPQ